MQSGKLISGTNVLALIYFAIEMTVELRKQLLSCESTGATNFLFFFLHDFYMKLLAHL